MKTMFNILCLVVSTIQCQKQSVVDSQPAPKEVKLGKPTEINQSEAAKKWLTRAIDQYFQQELPEMKPITTAKYYEYKTDATNVGMDTDGSLTEKQFRDKWKESFNTDKAGIGEGFLISGQDWSKIEIQKCELQSHNQNKYFFDVILNDPGFKEKYSRTIVVEDTGNGFLIADILE